LCNSCVPLYREKIYVRQNEHENTLQNIANAVVMTAMNRSFANEAEPEVDEDMSESM